MLTLGVDIGSLTGKALVLRDGEIVAWDLVPTGADSLETGMAVSNSALARGGYAIGEMDCIVSTGYGRVVIPFAHRTISEISCHARGAHWFFPSARTILDMGGQDCKAIRCDAGGKVTNFIMNDKCAAGAGRSMGIMADLLGVPLGEIGDRSLADGTAGVPLSSTCVVFARSEALRYLRRGVSKNDILAGACDALCQRVESLLSRTGLEKDFVISGGIAKNAGVVRRLERSLGVSAHICFEPQIAGALGAALFAADLAHRNAARGGSR